MDAPLSIAEDLEAQVAVQDFANVRLEEEGVVVDMAEEQEVEVATVNGGPVDPGQQEDEVATLLSDMTEEVPVKTCVDVSTFIVIPLLDSFKYF